MAHVGKARTLSHDPNDPPQTTANSHQDGGSANAWRLSHNPASAAAVFKRLKAAETVVV